MRGLDVYTPGVTLLSRPRISVKNLPTVWFTSGKWRCLKVLGGGFVSIKDPRRGPEVNVTSNSARFKIDHKVSETENGCLLTDVPQRVVGNETVRVRSMVHLVRPR